MAKKKSDEQEAPKKRAKKSLASSKAKSKTSAAKPRPAKRKKGEKLNLTITRWDTEQSPFEDESLALDSAVSSSDTPKQAENEPIEVASQPVDEPPFPKKSKAKAPKGKIAVSFSDEAAEVVEPKAEVKQPAPPVPVKKGKIAVSFSEEDEPDQIEEVAVNVPAKKEESSSAIAISGDDESSPITVRIAKPKQPAKAQPAVVEPEADDQPAAEPSQTHIAVQSDDDEQLITVHHSELKLEPESKIAPARIAISSDDSGDSAEEDGILSLHSDEAPQPETPPATIVATPLTSRRIEPIAHTAEPEQAEEPEEELYDADLEAMLAQTDPGSQPEREAQPPTKPDLIEKKPVIEPKPDTVKPARVAKEPLLGRLKAALLQLWSRPAYRIGTTALFALTFVVLGVLPITRYGMLNMAGMRTSASVEVIDSLTGQPLKGVQIKLSGVSATTDDRGWAQLHNVRFGSQAVTIQKSAYKELVTTIEVGHGKNQFADMAIESNGTRRTLQISDWLSGKPLANALVEYGEYNARANESGEAILTLPGDIPNTGVVADISADGYAKQQVELISDAGTQSVALVIAKQHYYVAKSDSGIYNIYKVAADGSNPTVVLQGTGDEANDIAFDMAPSGNWGVLAASRDKDSVNPDGYVLRGLFVLDAGTAEIKKVDESERIDLVDWIGDTIVYVKVQAGASGQNPDRYKLMSYDLANSKQVELASSNYFNDVLVANDYVFYAPSEAYKDNPAPYLYRVKADGNDRSTILKRNVWAITRTDYETLAFDAEQTWYGGALESLDYATLPKRPDSVIPRLYVKSPSGKQAAWISFSANKDTLSLYTPETKEDREITSEVGLRYPVRWLDESHLVFRVVNDTEQADYVIAVSEENAKPKKIVDVSAVKGVDGWYYYY